MISESLAASILSASCASTNNVVEGVGHFSGDLVEKWVDQSQSWFALVESEIVELRNETGNERAGGRGSTDELDGSVLNDQNVISDSSDIWGNHGWRHSRVVEMA